MLLQQIVNGLTIGSVYALVAIGYSLVFGVLRLINFSNGSLYMLGAYLMLIFYRLLGGAVLPSIIIAIVLAGLSGFLVDFIALRPLRARNAPRMAGLISTLGIGTVIDNSIQIWVGTETRPFPNFMNFGKLNIGNAVISYSQIIIFLISLLLMGILSLVVYKTKVGKSMRAVSQNAMCSKLMGINVKLVISGTFMLSAILACCSGILVGAYYQNIDTTMGFSVGMKTFAASARCRARCSAASSSASRRRSVRATSTPATAMRSPLPFSSSSCWSSPAVSSAEPLPTRCNGGGT